VKPMPTQKETYGPFLLTYFYFASMQSNVKFAAFSITDISSISICTASLNLKDDLLNTEVTLCFLIPPYVFPDLNLAASLPVGSSDSFSAASRAAMRAAFFFKQTEQNVPLVKFHPFAQ
jgi:hypothetical protein